MGASEMDYWTAYGHDQSNKEPGKTNNRPRENMVGVNMVLAWYRQSMYEFHELC